MNSLAIALLPVVVLGTFSDPVAAVKDNAPAACARYFEGEGDDPCWAGKPRLPEAMLWQLVPNR